MKNDYFEYKNIELNTKLTLLIDDIFSKVFEDFPNSTGLTLFTSSDLRVHNEESIPVILYISHKDKDNKLVHMYVDFSRTTPEITNAGNVPPYLYTTNKNKTNCVDSMIHVDTYRKELLETFPDIFKFKDTGYIRKETDGKNYQTELNNARKIYMESKLQKDLNNKEVFTSKKNKI